MKPPVFLATRLWSFVLVAVFTIGFAATGRMVIGSGSYWTILAIVATAVNFFLSAKTSVKLFDYHVGRGRWFGSHLWVSAAYSAIATGVLVPVMTSLQQQNGSYKGYDSFIVTAGDVQMFDTNGEPYILHSAGVSLDTIVFTSIVVATCFMTACAVGTAIGAMYGHRGGVAVTVLVTLCVTACVIALVILVVFGIQVRAPWPGALMFLAPITAVAWLVSTFAISRK